MSQENVELAHRTYQAFNRRDLDAFLALMDPEVNFTTRFVEMEGGSFHRHDGVRRWWEDLLSFSPDYQAEVLEIRDSASFVIVGVRVQGRARDSGVPVEETIWQVGKWRDRKAVWWAVYPSKAEALEAVGLRE
jgi:ketosteroid isomerase-like protein